MNAQLPIPSLDDVVKERCKRSLAYFIQAAWPIVEPGRPYIHNWHIECVAEHLEYVSRGEIIRLLINQPPGTMKSLMVSVFFPAWLWGPAGHASHRTIGASYRLDLATRDSLKQLNLVQSDWYQRLWGDTVSLNKEGESEFHNTAMGWRKAMPFRSITGERGDGVIVDDPHSVEGAESDAERKRTVRMVRETLPTRVNDPLKSFIIIMMQRLHEGDASGEILSKEDHMGYEHLMLPMRFEKARACVTRLGTVDLRTEEGELLFPARFPREVVDRDEAAMTEYAVSGQHQQEPTPRGGGLFKRDWFPIVESAPIGGVECRGWDLAASTDENAAYTVGVKIKRVGDIFFVMDVKRDRWGPGATTTAIVNTATQDGKHCIVDLPQDPGQAGKDQKRSMVTALLGFDAHATPETGDKEQRANPFAAQAEIGNVRIVKGPWNEAYLDELCKFPRSKYKDQVDASSRAFNRLVRPRSTIAPNVLTRLG